jgi:hypothetical protein
MGDYGGMMGHQSLGGSNGLAFGQQLGSVNPMMPATGYSMLEVVKRADGGDMKDNKALPTAIGGRAYVATAAPRWENKAGTSAQPYGSVEPNRLGTYYDYIQDGRHGESIQV